MFGTCGRCGISGRCGRSIAGRSNCGGAWICGRSANGGSPRGRSTGRSIPGAMRTSPPDSPLRSSRYGFLLASDPETDAGCRGRPPTLSESCCRCGSADSFPSLLLPLPPAPYGPRSIAAGPGSRTRTTRSATRCCSRTMAWTRKRVPTASKSAACGSHAGCGTWTSKSPS